MTWELRRLEDSPILLIVDTYKMSMTNVLHFLTEEEMK